MHNSFDFKEFVWITRIFYLFNPVLLILSDRIRIFQTVQFFFHCFCVGQIEIDFRLGNFGRLSINHAPETFINIEMISELLGHSNLHHELIILEFKVGQHLLVRSAVNFRQVTSFFALRPLGDRFVQI